MSINSLLGTELPIVQAPMAGVQGSALAIAVSNAGGLGSLPCAMLGTDAIRREFENILSRTSRPFNANFFLPQPTLAECGKGKCVACTFYALIHGVWNQRGDDSHWCGAFAFQS